MATLFDNKFAMNYKAIKKYIDLLYKSRNKTPQQQLEIVHDISRRGFLKDILNIVALGLAAKTCCAIPSEYNLVLPDIGDSDRSNLSPHEADFLGRQIVLDITKKGSMLNDYDVTAYLNEVGSDLASYSSLAGHNFNFYLIRDKIINAFALPGGYICLYNGLIYTTRSEAELTSVMSHEIGHVVQHHIFRNISGYKRNQWVSLAGILSGAMLATVNPGAGMLAMHGSQGLATQNMLSNSRDFEREADRVGQKIMYNAGFDPHAMPEFFKRLKDTTKFNDNEAFEFLRTHPVTSERISEAETRANHLQTKMRPDSPGFLLMREKSRVRQLGTNQAQQFYATTLKTKKYTHIDTQYYGLAFALFLDEKFKDSVKYLDYISADSFKNYPAIISLKALNQVALGEFRHASRLYEEGLTNYPTYKSLWLGQADLLIKSKQFKVAIDKLDSLSRDYPEDVDIWARIASIYSDSLNNAQRYHYALGNKTFLLGNYVDAITQYQMALVPSKTSDVKLNDVIKTHLIMANETRKFQISCGG